MKRLSKTHLLVLDDLGLAPLTDTERRDLLELIEDRSGSTSTLITSQLPIDHWHDHIEDPTIADAIMDRLIHTAHQFQLKEDRCERNKNLTETKESVNIRKLQRRFAPRGWPEWIGSDGHVQSEHPVRIFRIGWPNPSGYAYQYMHKQKRDQIVKNMPKTLRDLLLEGRHEFIYDLVPIRLRRMPWGKRINLLKAGLNLFYRKPCPWNRPFNMQIELTNYCNLRCPVCPTGTGELRRRPTAMSVDLFERLMDQWGRYLLTIALFAWGEPLLHPQLKKILEIASRYPIVTRLSTNGQSLDDDKVIEALMSFPPTYLIVALDGLADETNSKYRIGAKLAPALAGVKRLAEFKKQKGEKLPVLHMRYIAMKHNQHELPEVRKFAADHQFELVSIRSLSTIDTDDHNSHHRFVTEIERYQPFQNDDRSKGFICDYPFIFPTMLADGTIVACDQDYNGQLPLGVATKECSFDDLWFDRQASLARKRVRDNPKSLRFCRNCPYSRMVTGTCSVEIHKLDPSSEAPVLG